MNQRLWRLQTSTVLMLWRGDAAVETLPRAEAAKSLALISVSCRGKKKNKEGKKTAAVDDECVTQHDGEADKHTHTPDTHTRLTHNLTFRNCLFGFSVFCGGSGSVTCSQERPGNLKQIIN